MDDIQNLAVIGCPVAIIVLLLLLKILRSINPRGGKW